MAAAFLTAGLAARGFGLGEPAFLTGVAAVRFAATTFRLVSGVEVFRFVVEGLALAAAGTARLAEARLEAGAAPGRADLGFAFLGATVLAVLREAFAVLCLERADSAVLTGLDLAGLLACDFLAAVRFELGSGSSAYLAATGLVREGFGRGSSTGAKTSLLTLGLRLMLDSSAFRTQLNSRAAVRSSMTFDRFASFTSPRMQTTFAALCLTHFARLCFLISARIESVSPMQTAAWWPRPNLSMRRREIMKTAGPS